MSIQMSDNSQSTVGVRSSRAGNGNDEKKRDGSRDSLKNVPKSGRRGRKKFSSAASLDVSPTASEDPQDITENPTRNAAKPMKPTKQPKIVSFFSDEEEEYSTESSYSISQRARDLLLTRKTLPVYIHKDKILENIKTNKVTVLIGETGSGKSTQIPQFLIASNKKAIAVTQPRRVAAINLASRVAQEYGTKLGDKVGYSVRFDNKSSAKTKLRYLTDGMLLRELMLDPMLRSYSTIIIDEAHERTILTDMLMGFLKKMLDSRGNDTDFKIIIMSATLDADKFSQFFDGCPILYVEGKMFPVDRFYLNDPADDVIDTAVNTAVQINSAEPQGDVLVFLAGQEEIDKACYALNELAPLLPKEAPRLVALPLYAALPPALQMKVFDPVKRHERKIILSTNIAETSVTVPGVRYVVDGGLRKVKVWRPQLGLSTLLSVPISQASATQRAGRAGREMPGKTFRLYTESDYAKLPQQTEPEIIRSDISHCILMLKKLQVDDVMNWAWIEHPGKESLFSALSQLYSLKALDDNGKITKLGQQMAVLPVSPQFGAVLISAHDSGCLQTVIDIIACLNVENLILNPPSDKRDEVNEKRRQTCSLGAKYGDLLMFKELLNYFSELSSDERRKWCKELFLNYRGFKNVFRIRAQIAQYMKNLFGDISSVDDSEYFDIISKKSSDPIDIESVLKSFLKGYIANTALGYLDRSYRTVFSGQLISIHPSSLLFGKKNDAIVYIEFVYTAKGYARIVCAIDPSWLSEIAPHVVGREKVN